MAHGPATSPSSPSSCNGGPQSSPLGASTRRCSPPFASRASSRAKTRGSPRCRPRCTWGGEPAPRRRPTSDVRGAWDRCRPNPPSPRSSPRPSGWPAWAPAHRTSSRCRTTPCWPPWCWPVAAPGVSKRVRWRKDESTSRPPSTVRASFVSHCWRCNATACSRPRHGPPVTTAPPHRLRPAQRPRSAPADGMTPPGRPSRTRSPPSRHWDAHVPKTPGEPRPRACARRRTSWIR